MNTMIFCTMYLRYTVIMDSIGTDDGIYVVGHGTNMTL